MALAIRTRWRCFCYYRFQGDGSRSGPSSPPPSSGRYGRSRASPRRVFPIFFMRPSRPARPPTRVSARRTRSVGRAAIARDTRFVRRAAPGRSAPTARSGRRRRTARRSTGWHSARRPSRQARTRRGRRSGQHRQHRAVSSAAHRAVLRGQNPRAVEPTPCPGRR